jgi:hypothetical protein
MRRKTTWWRNLGGLLVACVLTLLVAAPMTSAAACLCADDAPAASQTIQVEHQQDSAPCKAACCLGGHCHHASPALGALISTVATPAPVTARHAITPGHVLPSLTVSALDRPPRG